MNTRRHFLRRSAAGLFGAALVSRVQAASLPEAAGDAALLVDARSSEALEAALRRVASDDALAADPVAGQHLGIILIELGVGLTVASTMVLLVFTFAERTRR